MAATTATPAAASTRPAWPPWSAATGAPKASNTVRCGTEAVAVRAPRSTLVSRFSHAEPSQYSMNCGSTSVQRTVISTGLEKTVTGPVASLPPTSQGLPAADRPAGGSGAIPAAERMRIVAGRVRAPAGTRMVSSPSGEATVPPSGPTTACEGAVGAAVEAPCDCAEPEPVTPPPVDEEAPASGVAPPGPVEALETAALDTAELEPGTDDEVDVEELRELDVPELVLLRELDDEDDEELGGSVYGGGGL